MRYHLLPRHADLSMFPEPHTDESIHAKHRASGPLEGIVQNCTDLNLPYLNRIFFLGHTLAGKTHTINALSHALGGFVYETTNEAGRTLYDFNVLFTSDGQDICALELSSNSGHDLETSVISLKSAKNIAYNDRFLDGVVLVYDSTQDEKIQLGMLRELYEIASEDQLYGSRISHAGLLFTKTTHTEREEILRIREEIGCELRGVATIDTPTIQTSLYNLPPDLFRLIRLQLPHWRTDSRIVYFGEEEIPGNLKRHIVPFSDVPYTFFPSSMVG